MSKQDETVAREVAEISTIYDIRQIIEAQPGKLMLSELVEAVRRVKDERDALHEQVQRLQDAADVAKSLAARASEGD